MIVSFQLPHDAYITLTPSPAHLLFVVSDFRLATCDVCVFPCILWSQIKKTTWKSPGLNMFIGLHCTCCPHAVCCVSDGPYSTESDRSDER